MNQLSKNFPVQFISTKGIFKCTSKYQSIIRRDFSVFENYSKTCENYDTYRRANFGISEMVSSLKSLNSSGYQPLNNIFIPLDKKHEKKHEFSEFLSDLHLLDAGCGTGNYIKEMVDLGVGHITGLELNEGMLHKCRQKAITKELSLDSHQCLRLYEGNIIEMPFKQSSFDAIMINMVLHHVEDQQSRDDDLRNTRTVLQRCSNVLSENGQLMITTCTPMQLSHGLWYYQFFPNGVKEVCKKWRDVEWWTNAILNAGFSEVNTQKICETSMQFDSYYDFEGPFKPEWRNADSSFALIDDNELQSGLKDIKDRVLSNDETRKLFFEECEKSRMEIGHGTLIIARK